MTTDEQLGLNAQILAEVARLATAGTTYEAMIQYLHDAGVSKPGATIALRRMKVMPMSETKIAVHYHPAYEDRRASDEAFQDSAFAAWEEIQARERAGSAAA